MQVSGLHVLFQGNNVWRLLQGLLVTINIALISIVISLVLGFFFGFLLISRFRVVRIASHMYLEFIRIMPQLVLLFLVYFGLARTFNINLSSEVAAVIVFSMWGTAEMGDLVRGALLSLPKHQFESGLAFGVEQGTIAHSCDYPANLTAIIAPSGQFDDADDQNHFLDRADWGGRSGQGRATDY